MGKFGLRLRDILSHIGGALLLAVSGVTAQAATVVGTTAGNFGVSPTGAATYSVPIAVPPGTAGLEPKLSLNYSSQSGNGTLGVGWSLGGLSAITRCPQTIILDGQSRGVRRDVDDRFCLDGQRLILASSGTYGMVGMEYRTEIESFSKIISYGGTAGDPQYFKVWTKAGQIIEFGNTADARVEAQGKSLADAWAVNKISDTVGNYLTFSYFEDNTNGEHRIIRIDYTGNATAGISPYNALEFQYEARPDPIAGYLYGSLGRQTLRLARITVRANALGVIDYLLNYEVGTTTGRSRLSSVTQCAANGDCLRPTTFGWQEGEAASFENVARESLAQTGDPSNTWFAMGDVNADGRTDAVTLNTSRDMRLYTADGSGAIPQTQQFITPFVSTMSGYFNPMDWRFWMDDLNGDGRAEPIICGVPGQYAVNGFGPWIVVPWAAVPQAGGQASLQMQATNALQLGDLPPEVMTYTQGCMGTSSNNGKADFVWHAAEYYKGFELFTGVTVTATYDTVSFTQEGAAVPLRNATTSVTRTADIDGDRIGDMVRYDPSTGALHIWLQRNKAFATVQSTIIDSGGTPYDRWFTISDVNGDGLGDMVMHTPADGKLKIWLSKGDGTFTAKLETPGFSIGGTPSNSWFLMADVNADGRADAVKYTPSTGNILFALSKGDGTFNAQINAVIATGFNPTPTVGPNPTTAWFQPADINGDSLPDWVIYHPGEGKIKVNLGKGAIPDLLLTITDGLNATRSVTYKPLTDATVYTKGSGAAYPVQDVQTALYVVAETTADDGTGGQFRLTYRYAGARTHLTGRGFLGFDTLEQTDVQTGIFTRTTYSQTFPYIGQALTVVRTLSGVELSRADNTLASKALTQASGKISYFSYASVSNETGRDLNNAVLPTTNTTSVYDNWGNPTQIVTLTTTTGESRRKQTDNVYTNDTANWFLGRLTSASVTVNLTQGATTWPAQVRTSQFAYDATTGLLTRETIEPGNAQLKLDTVYTYDAFGNRKTVTVSSPATGTAAIASRTSTTNYDTQGRFATQQLNALSHSETRVFDARFGVATQLTGPNGLVTQWVYDAFGRKTQETRADGGKTTWSYAGCDAACPATGAWRVYVQTTDAANVQAAPVRVTYYDRLSRPVREAVQGFVASGVAPWIYSDTEYDNLGRVSRKSRPYYVGNTAYWVRTTYDALGRPTASYEADAPSTAAVTFAYSGLALSQTNRKGQTTSEIRDSQGAKLTVTDAAGKVTTYAYDPFGNLTSVTAPGSVVTTNQYDLRGRKTRTVDPDLGTWNYEYDALGNLTKQTDAKAQVTTIAYDKLGRMTSRVESGMTSTWTWDTSPTKGVGKLHQASNGTYLRTQFYDSYGRDQLFIHNYGATDGVQTQNWAYDSAGRVSRIDYGSGFAVTNVYTAAGYLKEVRNASTSALYWQLLTQDAEGHVLTEKFGNNVTTTRSWSATRGWPAAISTANVGGIVLYNEAYQYDTIGNVSQRSGTNGTDVFAYDSLNRLTSTTTGASVVTQTYNDLGNITSKTGVGTAYVYGDAAHKHAVTAVTGGPVALSFAYDANGNQTSGTGRTMTWTAWNLPAILSQGGQTQTWSYTPEHDRYKLVAPGRSTLYINPGLYQGGHYEVTKYDSGTTEYRHTLYGAAGAIGEVLTFSSGSPQTRYFHTDSQGSIALVTDAAAAVQSRYDYDPWGTVTQTFPTGGALVGINATRQGYTGQEMLDGGLIHMNGRVYDPKVSRFISADPLVQAPYNLQSLNRYSYVFNNPMGYTDPTGFSAWTDFRDGFLKPVLSIAAAIYLPGSSFFTQTLGLTGITGQIAAGAVAGGITGGGRGALMGAVSAGMFGQLHGMDYGIGKIVAHGVVGGLMSEAQGGSFQSGFLAAGFTQALSPAISGIDSGTVGPSVERTIAAAVVGGTASVIGGGKFANGAVTGAFSRLFNDDLVLRGNKLQWRNSQKKIVQEWDATSGKSGKYDPIPEGTWSVKQTNLQQITPGDEFIGIVVDGLLPGKQGAWPGGSVAWGQQRIWLEPMEVNSPRTTGFSIHGGWYSGSAGCVDLTSKMNSFSAKFQKYGKDMVLNVER